MLVVGVASLAKHPLVTLGIGWLFVSLLPVSNLLFPGGILLAERTLYAPSIGFSFLIGFAVHEMMRSPSHRTRLLVASGVVVLALGARTLVRNPVSPKFFETW